MVRLRRRLAFGREARLRRRRVLCTVPVVVAAAMVAGAVRRLVGDLGLGLLALQIALHLLQPEVGRRVHGSERDVRRGGLLPWLGDSLAFADHAVLEVPYLHDALPVGLAAACELSRFELEKVGIVARGAWRE